MLVYLKKDEIHDIIKLLEVAEENIDSKSDWRTKAEWLEAKLRTILDDEE